MIDEDILKTILDAKENRAHKQSLLIERYKKSLISFTLNIPGRVKNNPTYSEIHIEGMRVIEGRLKEEDLEILYKEEIESGAGREGYIVVDVDSSKLKAITSDIEENHPLGRIFDIDIFNSKNEQVSRRDLGRESRRCLICDLDARVCMRMRKHTYEDLIQNIDDIWKRYRV